MLRLAAVMLILAHALPAKAEGERAGDFDYWVLALSWSPDWCALTGDAQGAAECDKPLSWVVHGLWPQYESGWPSYCVTGAGSPSRAETEAQADLFGAGGAAWYQWKKHGVCSGLTAADYYRLVRVALGKVVRPPVLEHLDRAVKLPASVVEEAFLKANPGWSPDGVTVTCKAGYIEEVRLCFDRSLAPRTCAPDTRRDCTLSDALMEPVE
jgi:ribonuclease T2